MNLPDDLNFPYWYEVPFVQCKHCHKALWLPYPDIPETNVDPLFESEDKSLLQWPPDEWRLTLACIACDHIEKYSRPDLRSLSVGKTAQGKYHPDVTFFRAQFPCANKRCKAPATVHIDMQVCGEAQNIEGQVLDVLRGGRLVGTLDCGHEIGAVPAEFYRISRVIERLW